MAKGGRRMKKTLGDYFHPNSNGIFHLEIQKFEQDGAHVSPPLSYPIFYAESDSVTELQTGGQVHWDVAQKNCFHHHNAAFVLNMTLKITHTGGRVHYIKSILAIKNIPNSLFCMKESIIMQVGILNEQWNQMPIHTILKEMLYLALYLQPKWNFDIHTIKCFTDEFICSFWICCLNT